VYDWSVVVGQYQALWAELALLRRDAAESAARAPGLPADPAHLDPFAIYAGYPTQTLAPGLRVTLATTTLEASLSALLSAGSAAPGRFKELVPAQPELLDMLLHIEAHPGLSVAELARYLPAAGRAKALRALTWLAKHGLLTLA
jgi:hypothetical protein